MVSADQSGLFRRVCPPWILTAVGLSLFPIFWFVVLVVINKQLIQPYVGNSELDVSLQSVWVVWSMLLLTITDWSADYFHHWLICRISIRWKNCSSGPTEKFSASAAANTTHKTVSLFTLMNDKRHQIQASKKLQPANVWHFNQCIDELWQLHWK